VPAEKTVNIFQRGEVIDTQGYDRFRGLRQITEMAQFPLNVQLARLGINEA